MNSDSEQPQYSSLRSLLHPFVSYPPLHPLPLSFPVLQHTPPIPFPSFNMYPIHLRFYHLPLQYITSSSTSSFPFSVMQYTPPLSPSLIYTPSIHDPITYHYSILPSFQLSPHPFPYPTTYHSNNLPSPTSSPSFTNPTTHHSNKSPHLQPSPLPFPTLPHTTPVP